MNYIMVIKYCQNMYIHYEGRKMICALYTLKKEYSNKNIYIWNINRNSLTVFIKAVFRRIDVQGFITLQHEYIGEMYMNRPVLTIEQINLDEDSIILVSDDVPKDVTSRLPAYKILYWSDCLEINEELRENKIIIYGTGGGAEQLCKIFAEEEIETSLYCVTKRDCCSHYKGKKVIEATELEKYKDYQVIISVVDKYNKREILETLSDFQGKVYIDVDYFISDVIHNHTNLIQSIDLAIKTHRKIYLYSRRTAVAELIETVFHPYGVTISDYVYDEENIVQNLKSIYDIAYEGAEDKLIIIYEDYPERLIRIRENVELAGFSLESATYTGFQWYARSKERLLLNLREYHDPLVGGSILYPKETAGWKLYGSDERDRIKIVVLGGSTSSEEYCFENWVSKLYYKLCQENIKTVIYNGAHAANDIVDELLRLLRDGYVIHPQIVISMSGVNNIYYKESSNQFNDERLIDWCKRFSPHKQYCSGLHSDESLYHFWVRNEKLLRLVSEFYGASFFSFLQPINNIMNHMNLREKSLYEQEKRLAGYKSFALVPDEENDYINLMHLFEHQDDMYFDLCHYTEKAHEIIASKVFEVIMPAMRTFEERDRDENGLLGSTI